MNTPLSLKVVARGQTGRSASRRLRKTNSIPAILYGKHTDPEKLSVVTTEFVKLLKNVAGRTLLIELEQAGRTEKALSFLQEIQRDPITDRYLHVDLHEVKADEKFEIRVPVVATGESFGVKSQSGVLEINTHSLRIRVLPKDLPQAIEVDVTELKVGETIKLSEMKPIPGVEFLDAKGQPVVSCVEPVGEIVSATPTATTAADGTAAPAPAVGADGKPAAAPAAGDAKAAAAPAAGAKPGAAPAAGGKPAAGAKPAAPAKK